MLAYCDRDHGLRGAWPGGGPVTDECKRNWGSASAGTSCLAGACDDPSKL